MHRIVKILTNDDGDPTEHPNDWHLVDPSNSQGAAALCTQYFFGDGESSVVYQEKFVERGGITCKLCLEKLNNYKRVKL